MSDEFNKEPRSRRSWMPVIHLLVFGALLALLMAVVKGPPTEREEVNRVVISNADLEQVRARWIRTWNRTPTKLELRNALSEYIRQEVLYREALARGLDREDPVVRLAMVNKLNMIAAAQAEAVEPTDEEIKAYFALRQERYRIPATLSFMHIYFNKDKRGEQARRDAKEVLGIIGQQEPRPEKLSDLGDQSMLQNVLVEQTEGEINRMFGAGFGTTVVSLERDQWQGPVESGYGLHLVKVYNRVESRVPDWTEVGKQIHADMLYEARKAAEDLFYQEIAARYRVVYDQAIAELLEGERD